MLGEVAAVFPIREVASVPDDQTLNAAGVSRQRYELELLLLCVAAALHAIETAGMPPESENATAEGLYSWIHEQEQVRRDLLLENVEEVVEVYAAAASVDQATPPGATDFAAVDEEFGERLMSLGPINETRTAACFRLCLGMPSALWSAQVSGAMGSLLSGGLIGYAGDA